MQYPELALPFELPTRLIQAELGYSNKTIIDLRNRLKQKGLIEFIEGNRREKAAAYILVSVGNQSSNQNGNQSGNQNVWQTEIYSRISVSISLKKR